MLELSVFMTSALSSCNNKINLNLLCWSGFWSERLHNRAMISTKLESPDELCRTVEVTVIHWRRNRLGSSSSQTSSHSMTTESATTAVPFTKLSRVITEDCLSSKQFIQNSASPKVAKEISKSKSFDINMDFPLWKMFANSIVVFPKYHASLRSLALATSYSLSLEIGKICRFYSRSISKLSQT